MKASDLFIKCLEEEGVTDILEINDKENADFMISLKITKKWRWYCVDITSSSIYG